MTVTYGELMGSPDESYGEDGMSATRELVVAWENRRALLRELLGNSYEFGGSNRAQYPASQYVLCTGARCRPFDETAPDAATFTNVAGDLNSYTGSKALLTVDYKLVVIAFDQTAGFTLPRPADAEPDTYLSYNMRMSGEFVLTKGAVRKWTAAPAQPVPEGLAVQWAPIAEHRITWHRVVNPPFTAMRNCRGVLNNAAFLGCPTETVLFEGANVSREFQGFAEGGTAEEVGDPFLSWKVSYVFREKTIPIGDGNFAGWNHNWNRFPENAPTGWDKLVTEDGKGNYPTADFTTLFSYEQTA